MPWKVYSTSVLSFSVMHLLLFNGWVVFDSLWPHGLQHARLPCPSSATRAYSNSCPLSRWCHPTISSSVVPFSFWLQSFPASRSFPLSQFFTSGGQSIGVSVSVSVLPMNIWEYSRLSFPHSQSFPSGSFHKPLILIHQKADRMKTTIIGSWVVK